MPIAVEILSHFIPKWKTVVVAKYKSFPEENYKSEWYWNFANMPIFVLVDWLSASASEIIAMALKEDIWATIIGTKTYWKWSIQTVVDLNDWSTIKLTVWKRYSPNWKNIDKEWFAPDIEIPFDYTWFQKKQIDNQLQKAIEIMNSK